MSSTSRLSISSFESSISSKLDICERCNKVIHPRDRIIPRECKQSHILHGSCFMASVGPGGTLKCAYRKCPLTRPIYCGGCLEMFDNTEDFSTIVPPCGHLFHVGCYSTFLRDDDTGRICLYPWCAIPARCTLYWNRPTNGNHGKNA